MAVKDINVDKNAKHARELVRLVLGVSATGQTAKLVDSVTFRASRSRSSKSK
jgi:hypothetical protein